MINLNLNIPENFEDYLPLVIPLLLLQLILIILAVRDILKQKHFKLGSRPLWIIVSCFISIIGPILYFALGKGDSQ